MMKSIKENKGITLVALVVTIIVLIILSTVSITAVFGDNGILNQSKAMKGQTSNSIQMNEKELDDLLKDYSNMMQTESFPEIVDEDPPVISSFTVTGKTESTITVSVSASDSVTGIAKYEYQKGTGSFVTGNSTYTFTGLSDGTEYTLTVRVTDGAGNTATKTVTGKTEVKIATNVSELKAGNYIKYTDGKGTQGTYAVLYDSSSSYGVQIVSMGVMDEIQMGGSDAATCASTYNSFISTLNSKASAYLNSTYATSVRSVGSVPDNPSYESSYYAYAINNTQYNASYSGKMRDGDSNYVSDWEQMVALNIQTLSSEYWLASRRYYETSSEYDFQCRFVKPSGEIENQTILGFYSGSGTSAVGVTKVYLRIVVTLKNGLSITSGTGTSSDPYILGT